MNGYFTFQDPELRADALENGKIGMKYIVKWDAEYIGGIAREHASFDVYIEVDVDSDAATRESVALARAKALMVELSNSE